MHAVITKVEMYLPDWNSLDSVRRAHNSFAVTALIFFGLLVFAELVEKLSKGHKTKLLFEWLGIIFFFIAICAEIAEYKFGRRNDSLSEGVIISLDAKAKEAADSAARAMAESEIALAKADQAHSKSGMAIAEAGEAIQSVDFVDKRSQWITRLLSKSVNGRVIDSSRFAELLRDQPKGSVQIWYEPYDSEIEFFASQLKNALTEIGWQVSSERFTTDRANTTREGLNLLRMTADEEGMAMATSNAKFDPKSEANLLRNAIVMATGGYGIAGLNLSYGFPEIPEKHFVIAIGQHRANVPVPQYPNMTKTPNGKMTK